MVDLGLMPVVRVDPPAGPTFLTAPPAPPTVQVLPVAGPPGPAGPAGTGGGASRFQFDLAAPAATWTITHPLGHRPVVQLFDVDGHVMDSDVTVVGLDTVVVTFAFPVAGSAVLT